MAQTRRRSYGDSSSTYSHEEAHKDLYGQQFGPVSFTDDDLAALSRRKLQATRPAENLASAVRRPMTPPIEEQHDDDDSVISAIPTGLRAQQEALSSLQKENFRLKLSLHTYRRKETLQTAQLESASSALRDFDCKKRALEKTLRHLRGEIIAGYRSLEKLVSEQADSSDKKVINKSHGTSKCYESIAELGDSIVREIRHPARAASLPRRSSKAGVLEDSKGQGTRHHERHLQESGNSNIKTIAPSPTPMPTRRHFMESQDDEKRASHLNNIKLLNNNKTKMSYTTWRHRLTPARNRGRLSVIIEPSDTPAMTTGCDSPDPWLFDKVCLSNDSSASGRTVPLPRFLRQTQNHRKALATSESNAGHLPPAGTAEKAGEPGQQRSKALNKRWIFCGISLPKYKRQHQSQSTARKADLADDEQKIVRRLIYSIPQKQLTSPASRGPKRRHRARERLHPGTNNSTV